jgi:hypothetical protein
VYIMICMPIWRESWRERWVHTEKRFSTESDCHPIDCTIKDRRKYGVENKNSSDEYDYSQPRTKQKQFVDWKEEPSGAKAKRRETYVKNKCFFVNIQNQSDPTVQAKPTEPTNQKRKPCFDLQAE